MTSGMTSQTGTSARMIMTSTRFICLPVDDNDNDIIDNDNDDLDHNDDTIPSLMTSPSSWLRVRLVRRLTSCSGEAGPAGCPGMTQRPGDERNANNQSAGVLKNQVYFPTFGEV